VSSLSLPSELRDEYPFTLRSHDLDGLRYAYIDEGRGPTLLFVHGNPTWSFAWRNVIKGLAGEYRCVAVDHLGMGLSDKPRNYDYRIAQHIDNLRRLIETLDLRDVTLIGHDWGGCIGLGAAARLPDRFARFVMMNTAAFRSQAIPLRIAVCRIPVLGALGVRGLNLFSRAALTMAMGHREKMTPSPTTPGNTAWPCTGSCRKSRCTRVIPATRRWSTSSRASRNFATVPGSSSGGSRTGVSPPRFSKNGSSASPAPARSGCPTRAITCSRTRRSRS
jgi:pimeloyl-ACP methyl ester carboxylesterase